ncbi:MAG: ABC transporter ATP-binding protein [Clostridiales bacterium]|nr:ABC transporter ATP-binding protein [Clostridiales bacterium]
MGMMFRASPKFVVFPALDAIRGQVSIFFEHMILIGFVLEAAEFGYDFKKVGTTIIIFAALITLGMVFTVLAGDYMQEKERPKVREKIKLVLYEKARSVDLSCYDDPDFYNSQVMAIAEVDKQIDQTMEFIKNVLSGLTVFLLTGGYFLVKDKLSIVFVAITFIFSVIFSKAYNKLAYEIRMRRYPPERKRDYVKRVFYLKDYAKEIRLDPEVTDSLEERFFQANDEVYQAEASLARKKFGMAFLKDFVCGHLVNDYIYTAYLVYRYLIQHAISLSSLVMLFNWFGGLKRSMRVFTETYPKACETSLYIQKIRDFLAYEPKVISEGDVVPSSPAKALSLEGVGFSYKKDLPAVLSDISLSVEPGEKIALVGYNGAGKTTLVKLLMRLYDTTSGRILADGVDVRSYNLEAYRDSIGTVFQDFEIFAGTVRENVILDVPEHADEARVAAALQDSGLMRRVESLPMKLDTPLTHEFSEKGVDLSGGEQQKLAISRVFYQNASLMILDEPSSALDPIAEYQLNHAMLQATKDKTVIFISHRLSTTRLADRIFMLEEGRIVEEGSHESLLSRGGKYAEMWKAQAGAYIEV